MNGIHDMGGMQDMGPVLPEKNEPVFHAEWERRMFAIDLAFDGDWNESQGRFGIEEIPPADYLRMGYYEKWLDRMTRFLVRMGVATPEELASGRLATTGKWTRTVLKAADVESTTRAGWPASRDVPAAPHFRVGQTVRARKLNPTGHTRLPRYARGKTGTVVKDHGVFAFNDAEGQGLGEKPQHLYSVKFSARELWGAAASATDAVYLDLWDDHLEPA